MNEPVRAYRPVETFTRPKRVRPQAQHAPTPRCVCGADGSFGLGPPLQPIEAWYCGEHVPSDYWTRKPLAELAPQPKRQTRFL